MADYKEIEMDDYLWVYNTIRGKTEVWIDNSNSYYGDIENDYLNPFSLKKRCQRNAFTWLASCPNISLEPRPLGA